MGQHVMLSHCQAYLATSGPSVISSIALVAAFLQSSSGAQTQSCSSGQAGKATLRSLTMTNLHAEGHDAVPRNTKLKVLHCAANKWTAAACRGKSKMTLCQQHRP